MARKLHNNGDFSAWDEHNRPWALEFATVLTGIPGATNQNVHEALEEARLATNGSGLPAQEVLGSPRDAAYEAFAEVDLSAGLAESRVETTRTALATGCLAGALLAFLLSLLMIEGWVIQQGDNLLFIVLLFMVVMGAVSVGYNYFKRGMMGACLASGCVGLGLGVLLSLTLGSWAFREGNRVEVPTLLALGLNLLCIVVAGYFSFAVSAIADRPSDGRDWLTRYEGALRGQHLYSRQEARALVAEARAHLLESGLDPENEFGDPFSYAEKIAGSGRRSVERRFTAQTLLRLLSLLATLVLVFLLGYHTGWSGSLFWWGLVGFLLVIVLLCGGYLRDRLMLNRRALEEDTDGF